MIYSSKAEIYFIHKEVIIDAKLALVSQYGQPCEDRRNETSA